MRGCTLPGCTPRHPGTGGTTGAARGGRGLAPSHEALSRDETPDPADRGQRPQARNPRRAWQHTAHARPAHGTGRTGAGHAPSSVAHRARTAAHSPRSASSGHGAHRCRARTVQCGLQGTCSSTQPTLGQLGAWGAWAQGTHRPAWTAGAQSSPSAGTATRSWTLGRRAG